LYITFKREKERKREREKERERERERERMHFSRTFGASRYGLCLGFKIFTYIYYSFIRKHPLRISTASVENFYFS
jgi:hypothetical protein